MSSIWYDKDEDFYAAVQRERERRSRVAASHPEPSQPFANAPVATIDTAAQPTTSPRSQALLAVNASVDTSNIAARPTPSASLEPPAGLPERSRREPLQTRDSHESLFVTDDEAEDDVDDDDDDETAGTPPADVAAAESRSEQANDGVHEPARVTDASSSPEAPLALSRSTSQARPEQIKNSGSEGAGRPLTATSNAPQQPISAKGSIVPKLKTKNITSITVIDPVPHSVSPSSAIPPSASTNSSLPSSAGWSKATPSLHSIKIPKRAGAAPVKRKSVDDHSGRPKVQRTASPTSPPPHSTMSAPGLPVPDWYREQRVGKFTSEQNNINTKLTYVKDHIHAISNRQDTPETFTIIRKWLHDVEHLRGVDGELIKKAKMLDGHTLQKLFNDRSLKVPYDIVADAKALYRKWCRADFDADPLRGIKYGPRSKAASLDEEYPSRLSFKYFGTGDLVSGQWWPNQIMTIRDGAHGASQGGISGLSGEGAYSVIVAGAYKEDKDEGDVIHYCGTEDKTKGGVMTNDTTLLFDNIRSGKPVRVIRSGGKKENKSIYKPASGYRYDGVYNVVESELLDQRTAHHRFKLVRQQGQDPIRYKGAFARPSEQDEETYVKVRKLLQGKGE